MKKPNLFLIGVPKSGTTSMHEYLRKHPEIFISEIKGANFFGERKKMHFPHLTDKNNYLALFSKATNEKVIADNSHYFSSKTAQKQIKEFNPDAKILIIIRNPIAVVYSNYTSERECENLSEEDFENFLNSKDAKEMHLNLKYHDNIKRYHDVFGKEKVHIIVLEEIIKAPEKNLKELCQFLDISPRTKGFKHTNKTRRFRNKWFSNLIQKIPPNTRASLKFNLPNKLVRAIQYINKKIVCAEVRNVEYEYKGKTFKEEIEKTGKLINKDLKEIWKFKRRRKNGR